MIPSSPTPELKAEWNALVAHALRESLEAMVEGSPEERIHEAGPGFFCDYRLNPYASAEAMMAGEFLPTPESDSRI